MIFPMPQPSLVYGLFPLPHKLRCFAASVHTRPRGLLGGQGPSPGGVSVLFADEVEARMVIPLPSFPTHKQTGKGHSNNKKKRQNINHRSPPCLPVWQSGSPKHRRRRP